MFQMSEERIDYLLIVESFGKIKRFDYYFIPYTNRNFYDWEIVY